MPSVYDIKPKFQNLLRPLTRALANGGITANQVTLLAAIGSAAVGAALVRQAGQSKIWALLPIWLFIRMALNAIDGMLAREHQQQSRLGALLNELGDVISDVVLYLPFALHSAFSSRAIVIVVILAVISELTGILGVQIQSTRRYEGPMGKSDRALVFGLLGLALACGLSPGRWVSYVVGAVAVLLVVTIFNRARAALRESA